MAEKITMIDLLKETDALTYINSLKVTLSELKREYQTIEEMQSYIAEASDRSKKLLRKADNQYRLIVKLVNKDAGTVDGANITVDNNLEQFAEIEEIMSDEPRRGL